MVKMIKIESINDTAVVDTFHVECPRCKKKALKKIASNARNSINASFEKRVSNCMLLVIACQHCGFWVNTGFVPNSHKSKIEYIKSFGFGEYPCTYPTGHVCMSLLLVANGSSVRVRKDGSVAFDRIGGKTGDFPDEAVKHLLACIDISETLDKSKTYLSRWLQSENRLEVICGSVPNISLHSEASAEWEDSLIMPKIDNIAPEKFYQFIGIFLNNNKN